MNIQNTVYDFLQLVEGKQTLTIEDLETYYASYPTIFQEYFMYHCPKTEERLMQAIGKYGNDLDDIRLVAERLPHIIEDATRAYVERFDLEVDHTSYLLVGGYGSNAFVERKIISDVYYCAEKLSADPDHLRVIVAHELGHIYHNALSDQQEMDWGTVDWTNGLISLYREGVATYCSMLISPGLDESVYYTYNNEGEPWLSAYTNQKKDIQKRFYEDVMAGWDMTKEKEWFRLSGGSYFGYNRLGYLLGTDYVRQLAARVGEKEAILYWHEHDVKQDILKWLQGESK